MPETWRGVLIGCGFFAANQMHAWAGLEGARIVAVCDLDIDKARQMAERFGIAAAFDDADEMLASVDFDFVDIATTSASHRLLVEAAVKRARLVICQKPFADTLGDAAAMVEAARAATTSSA